MQYCRVWPPKRIAVDDCRIVPRRESQANAHPSQMSRSALQAAAALGVGLAAAGALRTDAHALAAEPHPEADPALQVSDE